MSNSTHKSLVRVLLWWVTILSVSQVVQLVLFLTMGHYKQSQNEAGQVTTVQTPGPRGLWSSSESGVSSVKARMFNFKAKGVHQNRITWYAVDSRNLPTDEGQTGALNIKEDGHFFMCLRITLDACSACDKEGTEVVKVNLLNQDNDSILLGWINNKTRSTGLLCKQKRLEAGTTLRVEIQTKFPNLSSMTINTKQNVTSLDVIYTPI